MKIPLLPLLLALATAAGLTACDSVNSVERETPTAQPQIVTDKRVVMDPTLNKIVSIINVEETTVSTGVGILKIQVELRNRTSSTQRFTYHVDWFDGNGMIVPTTAGWVIRQILSQETMDITAVAPTETAKDFRVQFYRK